MTQNNASREAFEKWFEESGLVEMTYGMPWAFEAGQQASEQRVLDMLGSAEMWVAVISRMQDADEIVEGEPQATHDDLWKAALTAIIEKVKS